MAIKLDDLVTSQFPAPKYIQNMQNVFTSKPDMDLQGQQVPLSSPINICQDPAHPGTLDHQIMMLNDLSDPNTVTRAMGLEFIVINAFEGGKLVIKYVKARWKTADGEYHTYSMRVSCQNGFDLDAYVLNANFG